MWIINDLTATTNIKEWWIRAKETIQKRYEKNRIGRDIIKEIIMNEELGNFEEYGYDHNKTKIEFSYCGVFTESKFKIKIIKAAEWSLKNMLEIMNLKEMFPIAVKLTSDEKNSRVGEIGELSELGLRVTYLQGAPISHKTYIFNQASRMGVFHEMSDQLKKIG